MKSQRISLARKLRRSRLVRGLMSLVTVGALLSLGGAGGCEDYDGVIIAACPPADEFALVSRVLEKRCGTLDCHGTLARPLRVYGQRGLRLLSDEERAALAAGDLDTVTGNGTVPGDKATTPEELAATRRSICALEPERMVQYQAGELDERELILLTKPLELERHKGGTLLVEGGAAFTCISTWLQGNPNDASCEEAAQAL